jgi:nucleotide-binding universal stress UspA family protein
MTESRAPVLLAYDGSGISTVLGSVSNGVVHHGRRPVLVVPGEDER